MWIILLDTSDSMGEPFSGKGPFAGRSTASEAPTKLNAAVDAILERLPGRNPDEHVIVIGFTSYATRLVDGRAGDQRHFETVLRGDDVKAYNGTDIAAALREAAVCVDERPEERFPTVLLVTDGKSEPAPALEAKAQLTDRVVQLSAVLIDPTDEAEDLMRRLLHNGEIQAVTPGGNLKKSVQQLDTRQQAFAREVEETYNALEAKAKENSEHRADKENLCFSAAYPRHLPPKQWMPLLLYLHTSALTDYVHEQLTERGRLLLLNPAFSQQAASTPVPRGTELTITPRLPGVRTNPRELRITWDEDVQDVTFKICKDGQEGERVLGSIDICVDGALVGDVPISIVIGTDRAPAEIPTEVSQAKLYRSVFASYSRRDAAVVQACVKTYEALGIYVYLDESELRNRAGDAFKEALRKFITQSDVFQLYWSANAQKSTWVEMEWRHALNCRSSKGQRFVRPVVWQENFPDLPEPLADLQLGLLKLDAWRVATGDGSLVAPVQDASRPVEVVVLPILPGVDPSQARTARADVGHVVQFLEDVTGLRYYPVATLFVDDYIVRQVRRQTTVDEPSSSESAPLAIALSDLLQALALALHVRFRGSEIGNMDRDEIDRAFGKGQLLLPPAFDQVLSDCEWIVQRLVREFPAVAAGNFRTALGDGDATDISLAGRVTSTIRQMVRDTETGKLRGFGCALHSFTSAEYESVKDDLERAAIPVRESNYGESTMRVDIKSNVPLLRLAGNVLDEIETAVQGMDTVFARQEPPPLRLRVLGKLIKSGVEIDSNEVGKTLSTLLASALSPRWHEVVEKLEEADPGRWSGLGPFSMMQGFLETVAQIYSESANRLGNPFVHVRYSVPADSWSLSESIIGPRDVETAQKESGGDEPKIVISGRLSALAALFADATEALLRLLPSLRRSGGDATVAVAVKTFGIFAPAGSAVIDEQLRKWAREVGVAPDLTLPDTPRVLLCINMLDRTREELRRRKVSPAHAASFERSVLVHEHFHALVATAPDANGKLPQGPQHPKDWRQADPVNESLAAWMELHEARNEPEVRKHIEDYIGLGEYPAWPYAGAKAVEKSFAAGGGLPAVRQWVDALRRDPVACRKSFDEFVHASKAQA